MTAGELQRWLGEKIEMGELADDSEVTIDDEDAGLTWVEEARVHSDLRKLSNGRIVDVGQVALRRF